MALSPLAEVYDLAAWVGQEIPDDDLRAGAVLSAASARVRSYTGQTWTDADGVLTDVPDAVRAVVVEVAAAVWANPTGATSVTTDDTTMRWGERGSSVTGIYLTDAQKEALSEFVTGSDVLGVGTLSITGGSYGLDTVYVPTGPPPSGYPFPWYDTDELWP